MIRKVCLAFVLGMVVTTGATAALKTVTLTNGRTLTGEVAKTDNGYEIHLASGGSVVIPADKVAKIEEAVTPDMEYKKRLAKINPKSARDHYELGKWAYEQNLLEIAQKELKAALAIDGNYERASLLLRQVDAKMNKESGAPTTGKSTDNQTGPAATTRSKLEKTLIDEEGIYHIRLTELTSRDRNVSIRYRNDVLDRFIRAMSGRDEFQNQGADEEFRRLSPFSQVMYIKDKVDRENTSILDDILIRSDPTFMTGFRSRIWPIVRQYCATAECHGSPKGAGGLKLFDVVGMSERVNYTNFVILSTYISKDGHRLVDRSDPEMSLLIQMGLPSELSKIPHPVKIRVPFENRNSRNYKLTLQWIRSLSYPPYPNYRLGDWKPPLGMNLNLTGQANLPTSRPTTRPADEKTSGDTPGGL